MRYKSVCERVGSSQTDTANIVSSKNSDVTRLSPVYSPTQLHLVPLVSSGSQQSRQRQISAAITENTILIFEKVVSIKSHRNWSTC